MATLTIWCRYPDDDELTSVSYGFDTTDEAQSARDAIQDRAGGNPHLADVGIGPVPFHADTVWRITTHMQERSEGGAEGHSSASPARGDSNALKGVRQRLVRHRAHRGRAPPRPNYARDGLIRHRRFPMVSDSRDCPDENGLPVRASCAHARRPRSSQQVQSCKFLPCNNFSSGARRARTGDPLLANRSSAGPNHGKNTYNSRVERTICRSCLT